MPVQYKQLAREIMEALAKAGKRNQIITGKEFGEILKTIPNLDKVTLNHAYEYLVATKQLETLWRVGI